MNTRFRWRWLPHPSAPYGAFRRVGINADGPLYNPNNPADAVRAACEKADAEELADRQQRRSAGAAKAAKTRRQWLEKRLHEIAARLIREQQTGPSSVCIICKKDLDDPQSVGRGIGSECWKRVLAAASSNR